MRIGITGLIGSGKDTFAAALQRRMLAHGMPAQIDDFAKPLREVLHALHFSTERDKKEKVVWFDASRLEDKLYDALATSSFFGELSNDHLAEINARVLATLEEHYRDGSDYAASPRQMFRIVGKAAVDTDRHIFVRRVTTRYYPNHLIVSDVRFDNEAQIFDVMVNVVRPGIEPTGTTPEQFATRLLGGGDLRHLALAPPIHTVVNAHDLAFLEDQADAFARHLKAKESFMRK